MIPNPIVKVLSTLSCREVKHLLMGGQACVFCGGAEFSRDCDIVINPDAANRSRLSAALQDLVDAHYDQHQDEPTLARVRFWLRESRTPELLIRIAGQYPDVLKEMIAVRPLLVETFHASRTGLARELETERLAEVEADRKYWRPLRKELEAMRLAKRQGEDV